MSTPSKYIKGYCLVTGASHGIGKAICYEWASRGVSIVAFAIDSLALALKEIKDDIESTHKVSYLTLMFFHAIPYENHHFSLRTDQYKMIIQDLHRQYCMLL